MVDAEYRAYVKIVKNDRRQRIATFLLLLSVLGAVLVSLVILAGDQRQLVAQAQQDSRTRNEESRRYVTCLLILPIEKRDVAGQRYCFDQSDLPGGRKPSEFTPVQVDQAAVAALAGSPRGAQDQSDSGFVDLSSPNSVTSPSHTPSNKPQATSPSQQLQPAAPSSGSSLQRVVQGIPLIGQLFQ